MLEGLVTGRENGNLIKYMTEDRTDRVVNDVFGIVIRELLGYDYGGLKALQELPEFVTVNDNHRSQNWYKIPKITEMFNENIESTRWHYSGHANLMSKIFLEREAGEEYFKENNLKTTIRGMTFDLTLDEAGENGLFFKSDWIFSPAEWKEQIAQATNLEQVPDSLSVVDLQDPRVVLVPGAFRLETSF